jgi:enoyl-CoA hydratase/carnithine racemase
MERSTASAQLLRVARDGGFATLTMDRPAQRNALSMELMGALRRELGGLGADPDVRVVVLAGEGPAFSAGHDLGEMVGISLDGAREVFDECTRLMLAIHDLPQPVIARVHGVATAAGCQLVAACDLAVASTHARFATPGVKIGLFCSTPMVEVARAVGRKRAMELLLTGTPIEARTALEWGLVNDVVEPDGLDGAVRALAERVGDASPLTVRIGKQAFHDNLDLGLRDAYAHAREVMSTNAVTCDAQEGMSAFLEKRRPEWTGT